MVKDFANQRIHNELTVDDIGTYILQGSVMVVCLVVMIYTPLLFV